MHSRSVRLLPSLTAVRTDARRARAARHCVTAPRLFTGVHGNYLKASIRTAGLDPDKLPESDPTKMSFGGDAAKAWKDIWGCGQGIGAITQVTSAAALIARLKAQYEQARRRLGLASTRLTRGRIRFARQCSVFPLGASSWS